MLAAVVLIAAAFLVRRNVLDDDDADAEPPGGTAVATTAAASASGAVICITELAAACAAIGEAHPELSVTVEPAGTTLDRLAVLADGAEVPVWLTVAPFPAMVDSLRDAAGLTPLGGTGDVIAATPLVVATPAGGRAGVLATGCAGAPLWRCLGEHAGEPWTELGGEAGVAHGAPVARPRRARGRGPGLVRRGRRPGTSAARRSRSSAWEPIRRSSRGCASSPARSTRPPCRAGRRWPRWSPGPARSTSPPPPPPSSAALGATADRFDASYPEPSMWLEAVLAVPDGAAVPDDLGGVATGALGGWDAPSAATQPLPGASTMLALRALWPEAT